MRLKPLKWMIVVCGAVQFAVPFGPALAQTAAGTTGNRGQASGDARTEKPKSAATGDHGAAPAADASTAKSTAETNPSPTDKTGAATASNGSAAGAAEATSGSAASAPAAGTADTSAVSSGSGLFESSQSESTAPTNAAKAESPEASSGSFLEIGGYARGDLFVGKVPDKSQGMMKAGYGELALKFQTKKERYGDAFAELRLREGLQGSTRDLIVDLREAYVNAYLGALDLRLGKQIIVWGRADGLNPTNNLTPVDLRVRSPIEDDRRVGNVGARAFLNFHPIRLEGVWMPLYSPTMLPTFKLPEGVGFGDTKYPEPRLQNGLEAGRVHLETSAFEMSVSFLHGYAPLPGLSRLSYMVGPGPNYQPPAITISSSPTQQDYVLISRTAYVHNVAGFDFSTAISDILTLRAEAAYRHPTDYKNKLYAPKPDLQYVLGADHSFGPVSVIGQYVGRYVFDWRKEPGPTMDVNVGYLSSITLDNGAVSDATRQNIEGAIDGLLAQKNQILFGQTARVQHMASMRVEWLTMQDKLSLSALGMYNFTTQEWVAFPKIGYQISDHLSTAVGGEIYWGPKETTLFGWIREELSAGYVEMRASF